MIRLRLSCMPSTLFVQNFRKYNHKGFICFFKRWNSRHNIGLYIKSNHRLRRQHNLYLAMYEKPYNMQKIVTYSATIRKHANKRTTIVFVEKKHCGQGIHGTMLRCFKINHMDTTNTYHLNRMWSGTIYQFSASRLNWQYHGLTKCVWYPTVSCFCRLFKCY